MSIRWCILRHNLNHPDLAPWPLAEVQISAHVQITSGYGMCIDRNDAESAEVLLFDDRQKAERLAQELDRHPSMQHEIVDVTSLGFDVWIYNHFDGSTHVQGHNLPFDQARILFLASVGFTSMRNTLKVGYWKAEWHVACDGHRKHWRRATPCIDIAGGRMTYNPRESTIEPSELEKARTVTMLQPGLWPAD